MLCCAVLCCALWSVTSITDCASCFVQAMPCEVNILEAGAAPRRQAACLALEAVNVQGCPYQLWLANHGDCVRMGGLLSRVALCSLVCGRHVLPMHQLWVSDWMPAGFQEAD